MIHIWARNDSLPLSFISFRSFFRWYNIISFAISFFMLFLYHLLCLSLGVCVSMHFGHTISQLSLPSIIFHYTHSMKFSRTTIWTLNKTKQNMCNDLLSLALRVWVSLSLTLTTMILFGIYGALHAIFIYNHKYKLLRTVLYCTAIFFFAFTVWLSLNSNCANVWVRVCAYFLFQSWSTHSCVSLCINVLLHHHRIDFEMVCSA